MAEKKGFEEEEEHENLERWLLTYADMITLLTAFFILLYSMSVLNMAKFQKLAISVRSGFNGTLKPGGPSLVEKGQVNDLGSADIHVAAPATSKTHLNLRKGGPAHGAAPFPGVLALARMAHKVLGSHGALKVRSHFGGWVVELAGDDIFFKKDSARLTFAATLVLKDLVHVLPDSIQYVGVEGFSSAGPGGGFALSSRRALAVVEELSKDGVEEDKLSATGFGVHAPHKLGGRDYVRIVVKR